MSAVGGGARIDPKDAKIPRLDDLSKKERLGAAVLERFIGVDGVRLWIGVERAVLGHYGRPKVVDLRSAIFSLSAKTAELHRLGKIDMSTARPINESLLRCMSTAFHTLSADESSPVDVGPLSLAIRDLHDSILPLLRRFVQESQMEPVLSLSLTNVCIDLGTEGFLNVLANEVKCKEERELVARALLGLLRRFDHPEFRGGIPHTISCRREGCDEPATEASLCRRHAEQLIVEEQSDFLVGQRNRELLGLFVRFINKAAEKHWWTDDHSLSASTILYLWQLRQREHDFRSTENPHMRHSKAQHLLNLLTTDPPPKELDLSKDHLNHFHDALETKSILPRDLFRIIETNSTPFLQTVWVTKFATSPSAIRHWEEARQRARQPRTTWKT